MAVATDRLIDFKTVTVAQGRRTTVQLKTSAAWGGGAYVLVTVIQPRDPVSSPKPRRALGLVYVPLDRKGRKLTVDIGTPAKLDSKAPVDRADHGQAAWASARGARDRGGGGRGHPAPDPARRTPTRSTGTSASARSASTTATTTAACSTPTSARRRRSTSAATSWAARA